MTLIGMLYSCATRTASDLQPEFFPVQVQKGEVKLRASTSIPRSSIILTARVESSPPERRAIAFRFIKELLRLKLISFVAKYDKNSYLFCIQDKAGRIEPQHILKNNFSCYTEFK